MTDQNDDQQPDPMLETPDEPDVQERREFLRSLGKWSQAVIGGVVAGSALVGANRAEADWYNRGGGSWGNRGGGWSNRGGSWYNRGDGWYNRGGGWYNRGGGSWGNRGGGGWYNR